MKEPINVTSTIGAQHFIISEVSERKILLSRNGNDHIGDG